MLKVWGRATSSNVQKVMWTVAELGLAHERVDVGGHFGGLDTDQYGALNPHRLVPTVETDDGLVLWESNAIMRHLARQDPARRLWSTDPQGEAEADMWAEWAHNAVSRPVTGLFWALVRTRKVDHDQALIGQNLKAALDGLSAAEGQLSRQAFLAGETLSIADIVLGHILYRYHEMEIDRPHLPALTRYYEGLCERQAYRDHVMVDFTSLKAD
ncbi:MAG: glutathione S-transferase family protein [Pseudomonadota bacterium]